MADNDYVHGSMDASDQESTYVSVMKFSGYWGLPASMAIGAFVAAILKDSGLFLGFILFVAVFVLTQIGVKTFFSH